MSASGSLSVMGTGERSTWLEVLERSRQHDLYHLPQYHRVAEQHGEGTARLFVYREAGYTIGLPLLLRPIDPGDQDGWHDATSVYGYAGPVASHDSVPSDVVANFQAALTGELARRRVVAVFSRLHPLIGQQDIIAGLGECRVNGQTISIDLTQPDAAQRAQYNKSCRTSLRKLRELGFVGLHDREMRYLPEFVAVYLETMRRARAHSSYFFDRAYFEMLVRELNGVVQLFVAVRDGEVAAATLCTICDGIVQDHLGGTRDAFLKFSPDRLVVDTERRWALDMGAHVFHLGGGVGAQEDSVFRYKAGFSDCRHTFRTWRWIIRPDVYTQLSAKTARLNATVGSGTADAEYFPAYRSPASPAVDELFTGEARSVGQRQGSGDIAPSTSRPVPTSARELGSGNRPGIEAELIDAGDPRWTSFLRDARHDFYHLPGYVALCAAQEGGEPQGLYVSDGQRAMLLPLIVRGIPGGGYDAASPYGYPGPLLRGTDDQGFLREALAGGTTLLASRGIVSLFIRLHPLLNLEPPAGIGQLVRVGDTISIDLTLSTALLWQQTRANHRVQINRALRAGRTAVLDEGWRYYDEFKRLYRDTMTRVSATPFYFFEEGYFDGLRDALGEHLRLWVVQIDGAVAVAALFVETCGIVQYHLSGSDPAFASEGLMKLIVHVVRSWAKERGDTELHLGGGVGSAADSLLQFKAGFSPRRHPFHTLRVVVDQGEYARLVRIYERELLEVGRSSTAEPAPPGDSFFPAYRRPASEGEELPVAPASVALRIKRIEPDDGPALAAVLARIDTTHFEPHPITPEHAERIARLEGQDVYLLGFAGEDPVAYGMLRGWDEGYPLASLGIAVVRNRQHEGFGRMMMLALHDAARNRGATSLRLRVHPENLVARRLYQSLGYRATGEDRGEILMVVDL